MKNVQLEHFTWCNDFAAAKNYAISKASNDMFMVIDSDEYLDQIDIPALEQMIRKNPDKVGRIKRRNTFEHNEQKPENREWINRIFSRKRFHYEGRIHEQVVALDGSEDYETYQAPVTILHSGYDLPEKERKKKARRNIELLNQELQGYVGTDGTLQTIDSLLAAATTYLETQDITQTAANLESISASVDVDSTSEAFQKLYKTLLGLIGPQLSAQYYETGYSAYRSEDYATAIENLSKAVIYDETNKDAWLSLGNSYRKSDDAQNAITTYDKIIELFPDTETARSAQRYRSQLAENTAQ